MKKLLCLPLTLILIFLMCGCDSVAIFSRDTHKYLISAIGFDQLQNNNISICAEAIAVNSEDMASGKTRILLEGSGKTPETALNDAKSTATQNFDLSHCGVIALSENLSSYNYKAILDWCYNTDEITFSAYMVSCKNAKETLKAKPISSIASGYDIMNLQNKQSELWGIVFENTLYRVVSNSSRPIDAYMLPFISLEDKKRSILSTAIIKDNSHFINLNSEEAFLYSLISDNYSSGNIILNGEILHINSSKTTYKIKENQNLILNIDIKTEEKSKRKIKNTLKSFIFKIQNEYGDIFGLGNIIEHKNPEIWKRIKKDFSKVSITVAVK